jgi:hypothetical protein
MLKLFSCKRRLRALGQELPPVRPELRDLASTTRTHVSAPSQRVGDASDAALPRREPVGVYVMVDNFS